MDTVKVESRVIFDTHCLVTSLYFETDVQNLSLEQKEEEKKEKWESVAAEAD